MKYFAVLAGVGAVIASWLLLFGFREAQNAQQEASIAALACATALIPYVLARAWQMFDEEEKAERRHQELLKAMQEMRPPAPPHPGLGGAFPRQKQTPPN